MSLLRWFTRKKPSEAAAASPKPESGRHESHPHSDVAQQVSSRRGERMARREWLYTVVRECMNRAGVLSVSYKFKVLSLDPRGRHFLVMVDLAGGQHVASSRSSEIETMIAQAAKARHGIVVKAVYWRQNEQVAASLPAAPLSPRHPAAAAAKAAVAAVAQVAPPAQAEDLHDDFEPIAAEEVAAFRQALAAGLKTPRPPRPAPAPAAEQSYTLLTGFEHTEIREDPEEREERNVREERAPLLSSSQYGDLR
ncbi:MAG: hypothetical protein ACXWKI_15850 [Ramlibacter sp.]